MERIIKFRGQRVDDKKWIYGSLVVEKSGDMAISDDFGTWYDVIPETVCQFTGIKEVYEGDILKSFPTIKMDETVIISVVSFDNRRGMWIATAIEYNDVEFLFEAMMPHHNTEVIGNKFEMPELLNSNHPTLELIEQ